MNFIEEEVRESIAKKSEKIISLLGKCKQKKSNLKETIFDKETLKDFNDLKRLFREYRRRMKKIIARMQETNKSKKEVYPEAKDKVFSDVEIGLFRFFLKWYKESSKKWVRQYQTSMISF